MPILNDCFLVKEVEGGGVIYAGRVGGQRNIQDSVIDGYSALPCALRQAVGSGEGGP